MNHIQIGLSWMKEHIDCENLGEILKIHTQLQRLSTQILKKHIWFITENQQPHRIPVCTKSL